MDGENTERRGQVSTYERVGDGHLPAAEGGRAEFAGQSAARLPASHDAVRRIQGMIASGSLALGQKLPPQRELAATLNVSRPTLREALSVLETLGFIEALPGHRPIVCKPRGSDDALPRWRFNGRFSAADVFQLRLLVETFTARRAATTITREQIADLRANIDEMKAAIHEADLESSARIDAAFHVQIITLAGNKLLSEIYGLTADVILEAHRLPLIARGRLWEPVDEHSNLLKAFEQHDPEGASYYMRLHLMRTASRGGIEGRFDDC